MFVVGTGCSCCGVDCHKVEDWEFGDESGDKKVEEDEGPEDNNVNDTKDSEDKNLEYDGSDEDSGEDSDEDSDEDSGEDSDEDSGEDSDEDSVKDSVEDSVEDSDEDSVEDSSEVKAPQKEEGEDLYRLWVSLIVSELKYIFLKLSSMFVVDYDDY